MDSAIQAFNILFLVIGIPTAIWTIIILWCEYKYEKYIDDIILKKYMYEIVMNAVEQAIKNKEQKQEKDEN